MYYIINLSICLYIFSLFIFFYFPEKHIYNIYFVFFFMY